MAVRMVGTLLAATLLASAASAQTVSNDVVVMRRVVAPPSDKVTNPAFSWKEGDWTSAGPRSTCGPNPQTRPVSCVRNGSTAVDPSNCTGTKPASTRNDPDESGCTFAWGPPEAWSDAGACSNDSAGTRSVQCMTSAGTLAMDQSRCTGTKPPTTRRGPNVEGCAVDWVQGGFGDYVPGCSANAYRTQTVECKAHVPGGTDVPQPDASCTKIKPDTKQGPLQWYGSCTYAWFESGFTGSNTCSENATLTQTVTCRRSDGTDVTDETKCSAAGPKPAASKSGPNYSTCSGKVSNGDFEAGSDGWTTSGASVGSAERHGGLRSMQITNNGYAQQPFSYPRGRSGKVTYWAKSDTGACASLENYVYYGTTGQFFLLNGGKSVCGTTWQQFTADFPISTKSDPIPALLKFMVIYSSGMTVSVDDVVITIN